MPTSPLAAVVSDIRGGAALTVRVIPRARRTEIAGTRQDALLVRLAAAPADGGANQALIELLGRVLDVPRRRLLLRTGQRSRLKRIDVMGLAADAVRRRLSESV